MAATMPTQIRIEKNVKEQATALFADLGLDMSSAVNIFLRQCILRGGLPFAVEVPRYNRETELAMIEAREIMSGKREARRYSSAKELFDELDAEAVRVVKTLPKFEPGRQDGEAVSVWYTLPINFKLQITYVLFLADISFITAYAFHQLVL